jgi:NADH-quinone oxidoreductase subunit J
VVQVAVYIDAIAILIIIVVMLTRAVMKDTDPQINRVWIWAATAAVVMFGAMLAIISQVSDQTLPELINPETGLKILGRALVDVNGFVLPFEIASVLLVAAMIGAIVVARAPMGNE